ncbi:MAG: xanthine dehydrogenase family protein molybdopterin-binding subunit [Acidimicrobiia bacterium]
MNASIGAAIPRGDARPKVRGTARYAVDVELAGMGHARLLRSPVAAGRIVRLDLEAARRAPGVRAVAAASDMPSRLHGLVLRDQPAFASEVVRYEGEPIAAVVADTLAEAETAVGLIELEIEEWEPVVDLDYAISEQARLVHPDWESYQMLIEGGFPRGGNVVAELAADPDGVDAAFASAYRVVEDAFGADRQYQAYLEPKGALASYEDGRYTIHVSHQFPFAIRDRLAQVLDVGLGRIRVIGHHIGGGFGAKLDLGLEPYVAVLARLSGRPVKLVNHRTEDLITCPSRENALIRIRTAVSQKGEFLARELHCLLDSGAYAIDAPFLVSLPLLLANGAYRVGPTRVSARAVYTNTAPTGAFRGVSGTYLNFAVERHVDHIANELGLDRNELRRLNLLDDGDRLPNGQTLDDARSLHEAFDMLDDISTTKEVGSGGWRGVGTAATVWLTNPLPGSAILKLNEDGTLGVITAATENGSGAVAMGLRQIAAAQVDVLPDQVIISMPDTDSAPYDAGSQGSRTTHIVGRALVEAGEELRRQILSKAAQILEAAPEDLELSNGTVRVVGAPSSAIPLATVALKATADGASITATGSYATASPRYDPTCASGFLFPTFPTPTYHVHRAEVEVDPLLGTVTVLRYVVVQEVGKAINPQGVAGQIQGGVAQGLGYALWEGLQIGSDGRYRQRTFEAYRLPLAVDVPRVEIVLLENGHDEGPFGARGVAEPPVVPVAAAIANAVADAIGAPINRIPITPADILDAIETVNRHATA